MVITNRGKKADAIFYDIRGLSTDEKPKKNIPVNSTFLEMDTAKLYYFTGSDWAEFGAEGVSSAVGYAIVGISPVA